MVKTLLICQASKYFPIFLPIVSPLWFVIGQKLKFFYAIFNLDQWNMQSDKEETSCNSLLKILFNLYFSFMKISQQSLTIVILLEIENLGCTTLIK